MQLGDPVYAKDKIDTDWQVGEVVQLDPVLVHPKGWHMAQVFDEVRDYWSFRTDKMFDIIIQKSARHMGWKFLAKKADHGLHITEIMPGPVLDYNQSQVIEELRLKADDVIVEVNGARGEFEQLNDELRRAQDELRLVVDRSGTRLVVTKSGLLPSCFVACAGADLEPRRRYPMPEATDMLVARTPKPQPAEAGLVAQASSVGHSTKAPRPATTEPMAAPTTRLDTCGLNVVPPRQLCAPFDFVVELEHTHGASYGVSLDGTLDHVLGMKVKHVADHGLLAYWNAASTGPRVEPDDYIVDVNGWSTFDDMTAAMRTCKICRMQVKKSDEFDVLLVNSEHQTYGMSCCIEPEGVLILGILPGSPTDVWNNHHYGKLRISMGDVIVQANGKVGGENIQSEMLMHGQIHLRVRHGPESKLNSLQSALSYSTAAGTPISMSPHLGQGPPV